jgi:Tfp pilus assembly protein PilV
MKFGQNPINYSSGQAAQTASSATPAKTAAIRRFGGVGRATAGFTLAEVLAALLFMAIVIPVALEGMHVASRAGSVAVRRTDAARVAERILNENIATTNWNGGSSQSGTAAEGAQQFRWTMLSEPWNVDPNLPNLRLLSVEVAYSAQGRESSVRLSTVVDSTTPTNSSSP